MAQLHDVVPAASDRSETTAMLESVYKRYYAILRLVCFVSAAAVTYLVWRSIPIAGGAWHSAIAFAVFAALGELLVVNLEFKDGAGVTPTAPIFWSAACVLGPLPAIAAVVICVVAADLVASASFHAANVLKARCPVSRDLSQEGAAAWAGPSRPSVFAMKWLEKLGKSFEGKAGLPFTSALQMNAQYLSALVLIVGLGGLAYRAVGGRFLIESSDHFSTLQHFIAPFAVLVLVSITVEHLLNMAVMACIDPIPGVGGLYGFLLRMKLAAVGASLPVVRGELFLVVVALILSYLYAHIRMWGFVLAAMPVVVLRDFFYQWVETRSAYEDTIRTLATYMQEFHSYTRGHLTRVASMSERLAREMRLSVESIRHISTAAFLHDIGKIGIGEDILDKPGKPSDEEWERIKEHPVKGAQIISHIEFLDGISDWIRYHHKWHNGRGYPDTDGNGNIPIEAEIIGVADSFDAMTDDRELATEWKCDVCGHKPGNGVRPEVCPECNATKDRTYRKPKTLDEAIDELRRGAGTQFHPQVVKAFLAMVERDGIHLNAE